MDIVLGVSIAPGTVRLVAIEGQDADGVTVEQEEFEVGAAGNAVDRVIDAIGGTREGVVDQLSDQQQFGNQDDELVTGQLRVSRGAAHAPKIDLAML